MRDSVFGELATLPFYNQRRLHRLSEEAIGLVPVKQTLHEGSRHRAARDGTNLVLQLHISAHRRSQLVGILFAWKIQTQWVSMDLNGLIEAKQNTNWSDGVY